MWTKSIAFLRPIYCDLFSVTVFHVTVVFVALLPTISLNDPCKLDLGS